MQLQTTSSESKFPDEYISVIFIQIDQRLKKLFKKYKGFQIFWNTVYKAIVGLSFHNRLWSCVAAVIVNTLSLIEQLTFTSECLKLLWTVDEKLCSFIRYLCVFNAQLTARSLEKVKLKLKLLYLLSHHISCFNAICMIRCVNTHIGYKLLSLTVIRATMLKYNFFSTCRLYGFFWRTPYL